MSYISTSPCFFIEHNEEITCLCVDACTSLEILKNWTFKTLNMDTEDSEQFTLFYEDSDGVPYILNTEDDLHLCLLEVEENEVSSIKIFQEHKDDINESYDFNKDKKSERLCGSVIENTTKKINSLFAENKHLEVCSPRILKNESSSCKESSPKARRESNDETEINQLLLTKSDVFVNNPISQAVRKSIIESQLPGIKMNNFKSPMEQYSIKISNSNNNQSPNENSSDMDHKKIQELLMVGELPCWKCSMNHSYESTKSGACDICSDTRKETLAPDMILMMRFCDLKMKQLEKRMTNNIDELTFDNSNKSGNEYQVQNLNTDEKSFLETNYSINNKVDSKPSSAQELPDSHVFKRTLTTEDISQIIPTNGKYDSKRILATEDISRIIPTSGQYDSVYPVKSPKNMNSTENYHKINSNIDDDNNSQDDIDVPDEPKTYNNLRLSYQPTNENLNTNVNVYSKLTGKTQEFQEKYTNVKSYPKYTDKMQEFEKKNTPQIKPLFENTENQIAENWAYESNNRKFKSPRDLVKMNQNGAFSNNQANNNDIQQINFIEEKSIENLQEKNDEKIQKFLNDENIQEFINNETKNNSFLGINFANNQNMSSNSSFFSILNHMPNIKNNSFSETFSMPTFIPDETNTTNQNELVDTDPFTALQKIVSENKTLENSSIYSKTQEPLEESSQWIDDTYNTKTDENPSIYFNNDESSVYETPFDQTQKENKTKKSNTKRNFCEPCGMNPIIGTKYICDLCNYDICENCFLRGDYKKDKNHDLVKVENFNCCAANEKSCNIFDYQLGAKKYKNSVSRIHRKFPIEPECEKYMSRITPKSTWKKADTKTDLRFLLRIKNFGSQNFENDTVIKGINPEIQNMYFPIGTLEVGNSKIFSVIIPLDIISLKEPSKLKFGTFSTKLGFFGNVHFFLIEQHKTDDFGPLISIRISRGFSSVNKKDHSTIVDNDSDGDKSHFTLTDSNIYDNLSGSEDFSSNIIKETFSSSLIKESFSSNKTKESIKIKESIKSIEANLAIADRKCNNSKSNSYFGSWFNYK